jgi:RND family efflux transporter MFP subunit
MSDLEQPQQLKEPPPQPLLPAPDRDTPQSPPSGPLSPSQPTGRGGRGRRLLGLGVLLLFACALALGVWRHYEQSRQVMDTAEQQANFVPSVRVEAVAQRLGRLHVTLPATTLAFEAANIFARASGYVLKRYVDIGDHVKAGQLLAEITAPEVEAQVAQFQNSLQQARATVRQNAAQRASTDVTSRRISVLAKDSWATQELADTDRYSFQAQQHATTASEYNAAAMEQQLKSVNQQKIYQQVVAPFDGVITQRNIDTGSLITADAAGGTSMFSLQRGDVIRVWVYVPQDAAFGVKPGIEATVRVPAMPNLTFNGKVTRIADALQPGTRTLLTEVDVPNPHGALQPGVYCTVELKIPRQSPALIVPASAIIFNQSGMQVAVFENGVVHLQKIAITTDYGTEVEVNEGVKDGDKVILQPPVNLADGDKVQIAPEPPQATP